MVAIRRACRRGGSLRRRWARRLISLLIRSSGLVDQILDQRGNAVKATTSVWRRPASWSRTCSRAAVTVSVSGWANTLRNTAAAVSAWVWARGPAGCGRTAPGTAGARCPGSNASTRPGRRTGRRPRAAPRPGPFLQPGQEGPPEHLVLAVPDSHAEDLAVIVGADAAGHHHPPSTPPGMRCCARTRPELRTLGRPDPDPQRVLDAVDVDPDRDVRGLVPHVRAVAAPREPRRRRR